VIAAQSASGLFDPPLTVLYLIKGLGLGGAERLLEQQVQHRDRGLVEPAVAYVLPGKSTLAPRLEAEGCRPVRCLGGGSSWDPRWVVRLRRMIHSHHFDLIHVHSPLVAVGARLAVRSLPRSRRPRIVVTEHNVWPSHARLTRLADRLTAGRSEVHLAVSAAVQESLPPRIRRRTRVVRHGVDTAAVRRAGAGSRAERARLGVRDDEILIGTVANLRATKGYPDLLEAARSVVDRIPNARFVAVGRGPAEADLRERQARLGLGTRFEFLGFRAAAVPVMAAFDIFCLPSHHEGLPVALMEALALGLPAVVTRVGGVTELVTDGDDAVVVPSGQPALLADALVSLALDPVRRDAMGRRARARSDGFDASCAERTVEAVYREVVGR
jgi:glycosyltransferase involved in cell wall biosynthesis